MPTRRRRRHPLLDSGWLLSVLGLATAVLLGGGVPSQAQEAGQRTFSSPTQAVHKFIGAIEKHDAKALLAILGPEGQDVIFSGDAVADKKARDNFLAKYKAEHKLVAEADGNRKLQVGRDDWEFPIPIAQTNGIWYFDTPAGKQEILFRRIGHNELGAISVCRGFVSAQREYAATGHDGQPAGIYAQKLLSDPGKQNGLYWPVNEGAPRSPAGPRVAQAAFEGYGGNASVGLSPYHGYYYKILDAQGSAASGGAKNYVQNGAMTGGFALVAYPAQYKNTGVMTFIVNQDGVIYQKDLGDDTMQIASSMKEFNPVIGWTAVK